MIPLVLFFIFIYSFLIYYITTAVSLLSRISHPLPLLSHIHLLSIFPQERTRLLDISTKYGKKKNLQ